MEKKEGRFSLVFHPQVGSDDLPRIDSSEQGYIQHAIETKLIVNPVSFGKPLRHSLKGARVFRVGDYRVVFRIEKQTVFVLAILHRSIVYRRAQKRLQG